MSRGTAPEHPPELDDATAPLSKTRRKQASLALQDLGEELVALSAEALRRFELPEPLLGAILEARRITRHGARRRQLQYIGKLMRNQDTAPIAEGLARLRGESDAARAEFHALERWRERLLADDQAVAQWIQAHPGCDPQRLRQLLRSARKEAAEGKPPSSSRQLFRFLREAWESKAKPVGE